MSYIFILALARKCNECHYSWGGLDLTLCACGSTRGRPAQLAHLEF